jgi:hypothetical protein
MAYTYHKLWPLFCHFTYRCLCYRRAEAYINLKSCLSVRPSLLHICLLTAFITPSRCILYYLSYATRL